MRATQDADDVATGVPVKSAGANGPIRTIGAINPFPISSR